MNQTIRDLLASVVRTVVPAAVGAALAWLAVKFNIVLSDETTATAKATAGVLATAAYYSAVRLAEKKWAWVGWLLGYAVPPTYEPPAEPEL